MPVEKKEDGWELQCPGCGYTEGGFPSRKAGREALRDHECKPEDKAVFKGKIEVARAKELVGVLANLVDVVKVDADESGISIKAVDKSHVAMVEAELGKDAFDDYKATKCEFGMDLDKITEMLSLGAKDDHMVFELDPLKRVLMVQIGMVRRHMVLLDIESFGNPKLPLLEHAVVASLATSNLFLSEKAVGFVTDHITIEAKRKILTFMGVGDTDTVTVPIPEDLLVSYKVSEEGTAIYPLDYFKAMVKAIQSANVSLHFGPNHPVEIKFELASGLGKGRYMLAPRVESEGSEGDPEKEGEEKTEEKEGKK